MVDKRRTNPHFNIDLSQIGNPSLALNGDYGRLHNEFLSQGSGAFPLASVPAIPDALQLSPLDYRLSANDFDFSLNNAEATLPNPFGKKSALDIEIDENLPPVTTPGSGYGFFDKFDADGKQTQVGLAAPIIQGAGGIFDIYSGLKTLSMQEDALDFQKDAFNRNFAASKASFQNELRGDYSRKKFLGGNKGVSEREYVKKRSDF